MMNTRLSRLLFFPLLTLIACLAFYLRVSDIEARPLHSDESVNFLFIEGLFRDGIYPYSHENYHGPLYFFLMGLGIKLLNDSVLGVRLASIIGGIVLLFTLLPLRRFLGNTIVLISALLLSISPSFIFHSRYAIHETLLLTASLLLGVSAFLVWTKQHRSSAVLGPVAVGIMISTKETWVIGAASVILGLLFAGNCVGELKLFERFSPRLPLRRIDALREPIFFGYLIALAIIVISFSSGLQSGNGLHEFFLALPQWIGRGHGDVGHFKPWDYYIKKLIWNAEPHLLLAIPASLILALTLRFCKKLSPSEENLPLHLGYFRYVLVWGIFTLAVYSYIPYKTPWLIINLTLPLILLLAWVLSTLLESPSHALKILGSVLLLACCFISLKSSSILCYQRTDVLPDTLLGVQEHHPYGEKNPFSYVHTDPGMLALIDDLEKYWIDHPNARVLIGVDGYFPLPYYLRKHAPLLAYLKTKDPDAWKDKYEVIIVDQTVEYPNPNFEKRYHRLSDYGEANTYFKKEAPRP